MGPQTYLKVCGLETEGLSQLGVITSCSTFLCGNVVPLFKPSTRPC